MTGSTPLRVLFVLGSMGGGGAERQVVEILKRLDRSRFQPVLYLHHRQGDLLPEVPPDIPVHSFWDHFAGTLRSKVHYLLGTTDRARWGDMARVIRQERIDLVYDQMYLATLDTAEACRATGRPRISVCVYDPAVDIRSYSRGDLDRDMARASRAYSTADRVIAVSRGIRQSLIDDLHVPAERVEVHYNLLDLDEARRQAALFEPDFAPGRFHLLTVARLAEQKAHADGLEAVDRLVHREGRMRLCWHLVGTGPLREALEADVRRRGLEDHVRFEGFHRNPYPFYRRADLFCLPSRNEGFGCVLMEALACGLPVVSTDCPSGPREVLDDGRGGGLVPVGDPEALARAIGDCMDRPDAWAEQMRRGRAFVEQTFAIGPGLSRLELLFEEVFREVGGR